MFSDIARVLSRILGWNASRVEERLDDEVLEKVLGLPKEERFPELMKLGAAAMRQEDFKFHGDVLEAIGELGTDDSVEFIEGWLGSDSFQPIRHELVRGIATGAKQAESIWKERIFSALEAGIDDASSQWRFTSWPLTSWPAAMIAVDHERAVDAFLRRDLFNIESLGFASVMDAINQSREAVIPSEVARSWLPTSMPDPTDRRAMENYLRQMRAHAHHDSDEVKRRLWEIVERQGPSQMEAAGLLGMSEGLPDPVWKLDSRIQRVGIENVNPAERTVWIVANWFSFALMSGGFEKYATSYEANHLPQVIESLVEIGAPKTAKCLREWSKVFGPEWPVNEYTREEMAAERVLDFTESWNALSKQLNVNENVVMLNLRYQIAHSSQFEKLNATSA